ITFANLNGTTGAVGLETVNYSWNAGTNTLTATTVGGSRPGTVLFDIHVTNTATGTYVLTQHTNILETAGGNETSAPAVVLHYQAVDSDGSTSTAGTLSITFNDDAPSVTAGGTVPTLTVDETNLAGDASTSFAGVFSHNFGADGAASSNSVTYQLGISASGANSGLVDSLTGKNIVLVLNGNVVEGHVETTGGALAFTVSVNSSGVVTLDQSRAVMHPTGTDPDTSEGVTLSASNLVTLTQTVTDADGDSATATANIGQNLVFNDDGPVNFTPVHLTDTNNSTPIAQDNALIDDGNANVTRLINDSNNDGTGENFIGNDGFASTNGLVFTAGTHTNGEQLLDASSNPLTSGGQPIYVFGWGTGTLIATTDATDTDASKVVFTMTLNTGAGLGSNSTYSIDFNHPIDNGSGVSFNNLTSTKAGNTNVYGIGANATGSPDVDAMLTGTHNGVNSTVNTDATSIGVGNQSFNPGDSLRMDFVTHMVSDAGNATLGFDYTAHVETNGFQQKVPQVVGTPTVVSFTVWALETSDTQSNYPDSNPTGNFTDTSKVAITEVWVQGHTAGEPKIAPVDITGLAVGSTQALAYGISVTKNADGSVTFSGVEQGDSYGIGTGANHFNSVDVQDVTGKFDLGIFSLTQTNQGHPIDLSFGVTATDADGDTSTGTINMTLVPTAAPVVLDLNGDGVHFLSTDAGVHYDYGSGSVATAWASPQDGILAYDANHDGTVSNASEFVFGSNGVSDLQALAAYDTNHDGQLSSADAQFTGFVVWQDANSNGVADAGEVKSLMALGITSISLSSDGISYTAANGDVSVAGTGSYTRADGSTGLLADAAFGIGARDVSDSLRSSTSLASNAALVAAVAAAGLGSQPLAAHGVTGQANSTSGIDVAAQHTQAFAPVALDAMSADHGFDLPAIASGAHISVPAAEPNFHASAVSESSLGVDSASQSGGPSFSALPQGTDAPANGSGVGAAAFTANAVAMPDAALMIAAGHASQGPSVEGQHNEVVGKVLADALHGGGSGPNVDALVNSLPQAGDHGQAAADALATHAAAAVPNGDMGDFAGFTGASALHMMQQMAVHADAVPAHV
ncbi:MAG TPA: DUF5801 repeats-in-toxin domain-containing protein, partial [Sphingomicrobium sp.]